MAAVYDYRRYNNIIRYTIIIIMCVIVHNSNDDRKNDFISIPNG